MTVIVKVCGALVSMPPSVPPLSCSAHSDRGAAVGARAGVYVSVPFGGDRRLRAEQRRVVVGDDEVQHLARSRWPVPR